MSRSSRGCPSLLCHPPVRLISPDARLNHARREPLSPCGDSPFPDLMEIPISGLFRTGWFPPTFSRVCSSAHQQGACERSLDCAPRAQPHSPAPCSWLAVTQSSSPPRPKQTTCRELGVWAEFPMDEDYCGIVLCSRSRQEELVYIKFFSSHKEHQKVKPCNMTWAYFLQPANVCRGGGEMRTWVF